MVPGAASGLWIMTDLKIILGNKSYSSWSLRGWLALKRCAVPFEEEVIPLYREYSRARLLAYSLAGRVPILRHGALTIWDSLAIVEYLAERFPEAGLWPEGPDARATARAICAEMHAGFAALRNQMPMNLRQPGQPPPGSEELARDTARVTDIWTDCRTRFRNGGAFLFGEFTAADAFYAPVAARFATYSVPLEGTAATYRDAILAWPDFQEWCAAAAEEPWVIRFPAPD